MTFHFEEYRHWFPHIAGALASPLEDGILREPIIGFELRIEEEHDDLVIIERVNADFGAGRWLLCNTIENTWPINDSWHIHFESDSLDEVHERLNQIIERSQDV
jgi:hypothetical protein